LRNSETKSKFASLTIDPNAAVTRVVAGNTNINNNNQKLVSKIKNKSYLA